VCRSLSAPSLLAQARESDTFGVSLYPDDVFLVSYPKSGSTWTRFMIANYLFDNHCDFTTVSRHLPDLHNESTLDPTLPRPRVIKSHYPRDRQYRRVVYLARDGRDVAVSYYFHALRYRLVPDDTTFAGFLDRFNEGTVDGYGAWGDHVLSWLDGASGDFLLLRYEELKAQPAACLARILEFAGLAPDSARIEQAVDASSFSRMRSLEQRQRREVGAWACTNPNIPFVRSGLIGESRRHFTAELQAGFTDRHGRALERLGYINRR
jgi:hypothetical protein